MKEKNNHQKTVVVGMSGGVDSSLTAALLKEEGYFVIGVYMKNWSEPIAGVEHCPWITDQLDARQVAHQLGIPFYTVNFETEYKKYVVDSFLSDYARGRTPNPDVLCNRFIKFDAFYRYARSLGADFIATGHYAQINNSQLFQGKDKAKDQSYFLWAIDPKVLPHVLFPLGELTKSQVRAMAHERKLMTSQKKDSQGICFIGQADVRAFLKSFLSSCPGPILDGDGRIIGTHEGAWLYTIGQRVGVADLTWPDMTNRPILYVKSLNVRDNTLTVGEESALYHFGLRAESVRWVSQIPGVGTVLTAKIRYGQQETPCVIVSQDESSVTLRFLTPQRAITPGQSLVCYKQDLLVGGGIIASSREPACVTTKKDHAISHAHQL